MKNKKANLFERLSSKATHAAGSTMAFMIAVMIILLWLILGPSFNYSDTWQLVVNTGTTVITFLMVFLIQRSQNKESAAIQLKLNELVASSSRASNRLIDVEDLSEEELKILHNYFRELVVMSKKETSMKLSHSVEEAKSLHHRKLKSE